MQNIFRYVVASLNEKYFALRCEAVRHLEDLKHKHTWAVRNVFVFYLGDVDMSGAVDWVENWMFGDDVDVLRAHLPYFDVIRRGLETVGTKPASISPFSLFSVVRWVFSCVIGRLEPTMLTSTY